MRSISSILFVVVLSCTSLITGAQAAEAAPAKLGVVNVGLLLEQAPQAKQASANLEKEFGPQQVDLQAAAKDLEQKQQDYQKNKMLLTETQKASKEREITMLTREVQRKQNDIQEMVNIRRNEELAKLQGLVNQAIKEIGKQQAFDLILYEGIAYTNNRLDVTQAVLDYLKKLNNEKRAGFNQ